MFHKSEVTPSALEFAEANAGIALDAGSASSEANGVFSKFQADTEIMLKKPQRENLCEPSAALREV